MKIPQILTLIQNNCSYIKANKNNTNMILIFYVDLLFFS